MAPLNAITNALRDHLQYRAIVKHRSKLGRDLAPRYTAYLGRCRSAFGPAPALNGALGRAVDEFDARGFTSFRTEEDGRLAAAMLERIQDEERRGMDVWDDDRRYRREIYTAFPEIEAIFRGALGQFLSATYRAHFKIFFGVLYKSERTGVVPVGSQLWHADGGPGTCINVMVYLKDVVREDGAMECLPWAHSLKLYRGEPGLVREAVARAAREGRTLGREELRDVRCDYYRREIDARYRVFVEQPTGPAGLILPFRNNIVHKGGYPEAGRARYVCVFHVYPSDRPTPWERYRRDGIAKSGNFPRDPAAEF
jgi:hypothetical protein